MHTCACAHDTWSPGPGPTLICTREEPYWTIHLKLTAWKLNIYFLWFMKFRLTVWTSVLWRMILSMNPHTCVGSMLQPFFSKPSFTELFNAISVAIKKQHKNNDIKVNSYKKKQCICYDRHIHHQISNKTYHFKHDN